MAENETRQTLLPRKAKPLSVCKKLAFAIGVPAVVSSTLMGFLLNAFWLQAVQLTPRTVGMLSIVGRVWDAIIDPIVAVLMTRTKSRWGMYKPWLVGSIVPLSLTTIAIWAVPPNWTYNSKTMYCLGATVIFEMSQAMYATPKTALTMHLSFEPREISSAIQYSAVAIAGFTVLAAALTATLASMVEYFMIFCATSNEGICTYSGYQLGHMALGVISAVLTVFCATIFAVSISEQKLPKGMETPNDPVFKGIKTVFTQRSMLYLIAAYIWPWMGNSMITVNLLIYAEMPGGLNLELGDATLLLFTLLVTCTTTVPIWYWMQAKFGKKKTFTIGLLVLSTTTVGVYFVSPDAPLWEKHLLFFAFGLALACVYLIPSMMMPDIINESALQHQGARREAIFFAYFVVLQKFGAGAAIYVSSEILEQYGYDSSLPASMQSDTVAQALRVLMGIVVPVMILIGAAISCLYPITPAVEREINERLREMRESKTITPALETHKSEESDEQVKQQPSDTETVHPATVGTEVDSELGTIETEAGLSTEA
eukprot:m.42266 g.42266  ORF g.42266 m.42266 type:complete len:540 (-) comp19050_c0_seq2:45-1664(-)